MRYCEYDTLTLLGTHTLTRSSLLSNFLFSKLILNPYYVLFFVVISTVHSQNLGTVNLPETLANPWVQIVNMVPVKPQRIGYCEGPVVDKDGTLYFSEQNAGIIWKVTASGDISKWLTLSPAYVNGLDISPEGNLVVCEKDRITERDSDGNLIRVITHGTTWGQGANDITFASNGDLFFTAFNQHFWFHSADGSISQDYYFSQPNNIYFNGIEYLEEKDILYVCQWGQDRVVKYRVNANREVDINSASTFAQIAGPDGITIDENYNVYIASNNHATGGIYVFDSSGGQLGSILMRQDNTPGSNASNCVFGGPNNKTLYITGDSGAYKVELNVAGRVRPGSTSLRYTPPGYHHAHTTIRSCPEIIVSCNGNGICINLSEEMDATGSVFLPSGKLLYTSSVSYSRPLFWQPPSKGIFILRVSGNGMPISIAIKFQY